MQVYVFVQSPRKMDEPNKEREILARGSSFSFVFVCKGTGDLPATSKGSFAL